MYEDFLSALYFLECAQFSIVHTCLTAALHLDALRLSLTYRVKQKKFLLSSVTHVPSGLLGCALAAYISGQKDGGIIQTCRNFFARPCSDSGNGPGASRGRLCLCCLPLYFLWPYFLFAELMAHWSQPWYRVILFLTEEKSCVALLLHPELCHLSFRLLPSSLVSVIIILFSLIPLWPHPSQPSPHSQWVARWLWYI